MSEFLEAMQEASDILTGKRVPHRIHHPAAVDVRALRRRLKLSQVGFSDRFGFSVEAVRAWEAGRSQPDLASRSYLVVIAREPELVERALQAAAA